MFQASSLGHSTSRQIISRGRECQRDNRHKDAPRWILPSAPAAAFNNAIYGRRGAAAKEVDCKETREYVSLPPPQEVLLHRVILLTRAAIHRSDADADVLADYVLALLRHDGDTNTVRGLCEAEIPDFLKEDSSIFVQDVFDAIHYKSYLPGAPPPPQAVPAPFAPPTGPSGLPYGGVGVPGAPLGPQNGSRKRTFNDRGDGDAQDRVYQPGGDPFGRVYKQPRRGGVFGRANYGGYNGRGGFQGHPIVGDHGIPPQGFMPSMPEPPPGMPPLDPNNPMAAVLAMQAMGFPVPGLPMQPAGRGHAGPKKKRCRDYDLKGFCARGNTCMYEHGQDSIYVPPRNPSDEYDPTNSTLMTGLEGNGATPMQSHFRGGDRGRGRGGFKGDRGGNASRRGGRAEFSSDKPNYDKSRTSIVVENIPEERFSEDEVRGFFSDFGEILEVSMRPYKRLAIVKFSDWNAAKAAYSSPKVIFDNRFVKVYWYTDQESLPQPPAVVTSRPSNGAANGNGMATPVPARATSESQIDIEEFARKQQEVQKAHEEKTKKKLEMEAARKELEKRQEELLKSQAEEKRKLMEKIAAKSGKLSTDGADTPADAKANPQTEALKAQLAALEAEAQSLGIDTSATEDTWGSRARGRGRGGFRGRATFPPRGFRGGYRGRGGAAFGGASAYKLDNRPKTVGITGIDFTNAEKDENLRHYLLVSPSSFLTNTPQPTAS
jgi:RNA-binding protein 26